MPDRWLILDLATAPADDGLVNDLRAMALHELAHVRRRDPLVLTLVAVLRALLEDEDAGTLDGAVPDAFCTPGALLGTRLVSRLESVGFRIGVEAVFVAPKRIGRFLDVHPRFRQKVSR